MKVEVSDIPLFWSAYDLAAGRTTQERQAIFDTEYLGKGSAGLRDFWISRIESSEQLVGVIDSRPRYYQALREVSRQAPAQVEAIRASCRKLLDLIEDAVLADTFLLVGRMNSGGTVSETGLLIGVDMFGLSDQTPMDELSAWHRQVLRPPAALPRIVLHELVHANQHYSQPGTLLSECIKEGACDFVVTLLLGPHDSIHYRYGREHESALWERFKREMHIQDISNWLCEGTNAKDRPADLGYFVGHQICSAYYTRQRDGSQAIREMLRIQDFEQFLERSQYVGVAPSLPGTL